MFSWNRSCGEHFSCLWLSSVVFCAAHYCSDGSDTKGPSDIILLLLLLYWIAHVLVSCIRFDWYLVPATNIRRDEYVYYRR